jgi:hypothetical protein
MTAPEPLAWLGDVVLGQADLGAVEPNRGGAPDGTTLYWPYGLAWLDGRLYVADTGNRRVLIWRVPSGSNDRP